MAVIAFNFNKLNAERKDSPKGNIKVGNNVSIKDVTTTSLNFGTNKEKGLKYIYAFTSKFEPDVGSIHIEGDVLAIEDSKKVDEIVKEWKKSKKVKKEVLTPIINLILSKCNIKALNLSQDVNLPAPIKLPRVK